MKYLWLSLLLLLLLCLFPLPAAADAQQMYADQLSASGADRLTEQLPADAFLQTHRSFLVNLNHISHIDKSRDPWTISFMGSDKVAFVSRSLRHQEMQRLTLSD